MIAILTFLAENPQLAVWVVGLVVLQVEAVRRSVGATQKEVKKNYVLANQVKLKVEAIRKDVDDIDNRLTKVEAKLE